MPLLLIVLFIVVPIAELFVIIKVGEWIGIWPTIALLLADAILGSFLLRHQGRGAWRRFNEALAQRRFPGREVADGVLIVIGGTLLLTPGFLSDIVGILFLIPPTRALARAVLARLTLGRFAIIGTAAGGAFGGRGPFGPGPGQGGNGSGGRPSRDYDYEASAEEISPDGERQLPRE